MTKVKIEVNLSTIEEGNTEKLLCEARDYLGSSLEYQQNLGIKTKQ